MKPRRLIPLVSRAVAGLVVIALLAAACGGDDGGGGTPATDEEYVRGLCGAFATVAEQFQQFEEADIEDEEFLKDIGLDQDELADMDFEEMLAALFKAMFAILGPAMDDLADELEDVNAPADVQPFHDEAVVAIKEFADVLNAGGLDFANPDEDPFADFEDIPFPPDMEKRLAAVAENITDCQGLDLFKDAS